MLYQIKQVDITLKKIRENLDTKNKIVHKSKIKKINLKQYLQRHHQKIVIPLANKPNELNEGWRHQDWILYLYHLTLDKLD